MSEERSLVIPLVEEHVSATRRTVETGRVRVRTRVDHRQELVRAELARDEVEIERVLIDREIDVVPEVRQEGDVTIVPVVEEVLVVEKRLVLVEEIRLHRVSGRETVETSVTLAVQRAEIERENIDPTKPPEGE